MMNNPKFNFIFIHGFCFGPDIWNHLLPSFHKFSDHLINYPLYKNGLSTGFSIDETLNDLCSIVRKNPEKKWVFVGHSLGGYISLEMIHRFSTLIDGCILINSHFENDTEQKKRIRDKQISLIQRRELSTYLRIFYNNLDPEQGQELKKNFGPHLNKKSVLDQLHYMRDRKVIFSSVREFTKHKFIGMIHGVKDPIIKTDSVYHKFSQLYQGKIICLDGAHLLPIHQKKKCGEACEALLNYLSFSLS